MLSFCLGRDWVAGINSFVGPGVAACPDIFAGLHLCSIFYSNEISDSQKLNLLPYPNLH